jgi:small multidrug resistance pump
MASTFVISLCQLKMQGIMFYVLAIVAIETMAMTCFKKSLDRKTFFVAGVVLYALVGFLLCQTFHYKGLGLVNALWSALSVVATTAVGVLYFKETMHLHDYVAILCISAGVIILKVTE